MHVIHTQDTHTSYQHHTLLKYYFDQLRSTLIFVFFCGVLFIYIFLRSNIALSVFVFVCVAVCVLVCVCVCVCLCELMTMLTGRNAAILNRELHNGNGNRNQEMYRPARFSLGPERAEERGGGEKVRDGKSGRAS